MAKRDLPPGGDVGGRALPDRGMRSGFVDDGDVSDATLRRGFETVDADIPPRTDRSMFGGESYPNPDRMEFDPESGEYEDAYRGGFLRRGRIPDER
jgi:hypothetical protein